MNLLNTAIKIINWIFILVCSIIFIGFLGNAKTVFS